MPKEARAPEGCGKVRKLMDGAGDLRGVAAKFGDVQFCGGCGMEFMDSPFGFVDNFPGEQRGMRAEFAKKGNKDMLKKCLAASREMENVLVGISRTFSGVFLEPEAVDQ